jgi:hypothetical protein
MRHPGPLFTLLAGAALAGGLGITNFVNESTAAPAAVSTAGAAGPVTTAPLLPPLPPLPPPPTTEVSVPEPSSPAPEDSPRGDYTGKVDGGTASVAVSVRDGRAIAYVCDGKKTEIWLEGTETGGQLNLTGAKGSVLSGNLDATTVSGTVTAGSKTWKFTAPLSAKPAGLYRAATNAGGQASKVGWIVQPDGSQVGLVTTGETSTPAPPLNPGTGTATVGGTPITAQAISGLTGEGAFR